MGDLREHLWVEPPPHKRDPVRSVLVCAHCESAASGPIGWVPDHPGYCGYPIGYNPETGRIDRMHGG